MTLSNTVELLEFNMHSRNDVEHGWICFMFVIERVEEAWLIKPFSRAAKKLTIQSSSFLPHLLFFHEPHTHSSECKGIFGTNYEWP